MIPTELLEKYEMQTLEDFKASFADDVPTEINFYKTFLIQTNDVINKLTEGAIRTEDCSDELIYRDFARQRIAELEEKPYTPKEGKTIEERVTNVENSGTDAVVNALLGITATDEEVSGDE
jgi:hypothetical protein